MARRDRTAQAVLREALAQYFGGRYSRAQSAAQRALAIQADTPELGQDNEFTVLGQLLAAGSAHRMQDRATRDEELERALQLARGSAAARPAEEGARLPCFPAVFGPVTTSALRSAGSTMSIGVTARPVNSRPGWRAPCSVMVPAENDGRVQR